MSNGLLKVSRVVSGIVLMLQMFTLHVNLSYSAEENKTNIIHN